MKLAKRVAAAVLACAMSLCVLTACGGSSGSKSNENDAIASKVVEQLNGGSDGDGDIKPNNELTDFAEDYLEFYKTINAEYSKLVKAKMDAGMDYEAATDATDTEIENKYTATETYKALMKRYNELGITGISSAEVEDGDVNEAIKNLVADIKEEAYYKGKTVKDVGCAQGTISVINEDGKIISETGIMAFYRYN